MIIGRGVNIIRYEQEKNNNPFDTHWPFLFNDVIDSLNIQKARMSRRNSLKLITIMCRH